MDDQATGRPIPPDADSVSFPGGSRQAGSINRIRGVPDALVPVHDRGLVVVGLPPLANLHVLNRLAEW